jgi:hypothetical protein
MSEQLVPDFADRVQRALADGERLAERLGREGGSTMNVESSPEYQELVRLKVIIELETSRTLSETARMAAALDGLELRDTDVWTEVDQ